MYNPCRRSVIEPNPNNNINLLVPCSLNVSGYTATSSATTRDGKKQHFGSLDYSLATADLVRLDTEIASTAPPETLWLTLGGRAVDHAVEIICCTFTEDDGTEVVVDSLKILIHRLKVYKEKFAGGKAVTDNDETLLRTISDCERWARLACMGALSVFHSKGGPSHAIGHQLGSVAGIPHGVTSCICLPATLRHEKQHPGNKYFRMTVVNIFNAELGWEETEAGDAVKRFYQSLGLPTELRELGTTNDEYCCRSGREDDDGYLEWGI